MPRAIHGLSILLLLLGTVTAVTSAIAMYGDEQTAYEQLHDAIKRGDLEETAWLAERFPAAVNECPDQGFTLHHNPTPTALARAVSKDDQTMVRMLLKHGADVNPERDTPPLYQVESAGTATILIEAGARVSGRDKAGDLGHSGDTPLHCARNVEIAKVLLAAGAELNCRNREGETPLSKAIQGGPDDLVEYLFQQSGKVAASDVAALNSACRQGDLKLVQRILDQGVKIGNGEDHHADTLQSACRSGNPQVVELLLQSDANPVAHSRFVLSPVMETARMGRDPHAENHDYPAILKLLKDAGAKLDIRDEVGDTLLHLAARVGNPETTKYLISCNLDVNSRNNKGQTPLHLAAMADGGSFGLREGSKDHAAVAELLLTSGADPWSETKIKREQIVLGKDGENFETVVVTETFTPARYAARRSKWSNLRGEIDATECESPPMGLQLSFIQGATKESNAQRAQDVENGNLARAAVGAVLERFGAK
jgi:ankyrin repeat protein